MEVIDWIDEEEADKREYSIGGCGGWFGFKKDAIEIPEGEWIKVGHRWRDFIEEIKQEKVPYYEALRKEIVNKNIKEGGFWHQTGEGIPLFSDNTIASFSMRAWGDLMAAIWSEEEDENYTYTDFAWYTDWKDDEK